MSEPITWRSLINLQLSDAQRPLVAANEMITGGFDRLAKVITDREGVNQGVQDRAEDATVLSFKEALNNAGSPAEIAALSGQLADYRAQLGTRGRTAVLGAEDARVATLQDQITKRNLFNDQEVDRTERPIVQQAIGLASIGDTAGAEALLKANPGLRNFGEVQKTITGLARDNIKFGWDKDEAARKKAAEERLAALFPLEKQRIQAAIAASGAQVTASNEAVQTSQLTRRLSEENHDSARAAAAAAARDSLLRATGNVYSDGVFNPNDTQPLHELMVKQGIGDSPGERNAIIKRLPTEIEIEGPNGTKQKVPVPLAAVKQAILGSQDQWFNMWNQGWANEVEKNLKTAMQQTIQGRGADGQPLVQNKTIFDLEQYLKAKQGISENPPVGATRKPK